MIAVHAIWSHDSRLCVWAEDSALPPRAPTRRGRPPAKPPPRSHPFGCRSDELGGVLRRVFPTLAPTALVERELCLLLPSFGDGPQRSPHLLRSGDEDAASGRPGRLDPWIVSVASLNPFDALEVLLGLPRDDEPGVAVGDSARFLAEVAKLALELLARGMAGPLPSFPVDTQNLAGPSTVIRDNRESPAKTHNPTMRGWRGAFQTAPSEPLEEEQRFPSLTLFRTHGLSARSDQQPGLASAAAQSEGRPA